MTAPPAPAAPIDQHAVAAALAESAARVDSPLTSLVDFHAALAAASDRCYARTEQVSLDGLDGWHTDPSADRYEHHTGRFFSIEGIEVWAPDNAVPHWSQPIINQPETGILGILLKEFDGVLHCLVQLKPEPGNCNGLQVSPTVQATRSNYTRAHRGSAVPYLHYFTDTRPHRVVADVRQSEHGSWFWRKRNRNMLVQAFDDVEVLDGFFWLTLGQLHALLAHPDLVNMDTRSVLACAPTTPPVPQNGELEALLHWITDIRARCQVFARPTPLTSLPDWRRRDGRVSHDSGAFFDIIGVRVEAAGREVAQWSQPMLAPRGTGLLALLSARIDGTLHALLQLRTEPGLVDLAELAPTVQCVPDNYDTLPPAARPRFLDDALSADPADILFDSTLSDEGGRFYHARARHLIVEVAPFTAPPGYRWVTAGQMEALLRHSYYLSMQARSLLVCLRSLDAKDLSGRVTVATRR